MLWSRSERTCCCRSSDSSQRTSARQALCSRPRGSSSNRCEPGPETRRAVARRRLCCCDRKNRTMLSDASRAARRAWAGATAAAVARPSGAPTAFRELLVASGALGRSASVVSPARRADQAAAEPAAAAGVGPGAPTLPGATRHRRVRAPATRSRPRPPRAQRAYARGCTLDPRTPQTPRRPSPPAAASATSARSAGPRSAGRSAPRRPVCAAVMRGGPRAQLLDRDRSVGQPACQRAARLCTSGRAAAS